VVDQRPSIQRAGSSHVRLPALMFLLVPQRFASIHHWTSASTRTRLGRFATGLQRPDQAIAQTPDGYLWLGRSPMLRFDAPSVPVAPPGEHLPAHRLMVAHDGTLSCGHVEGTGHLERQQAPHYPEVAGQGILMFRQDRHDRLVWRGRVRSLCAVKQPRSVRAGRAFWPLGSRGVRESRAPLDHHQTGLSLDSLPSRAPCYPLHDRGESTDRGRQRRILLAANGGSVPRCRATNSSVIRCRGSIRHRGPSVSAHQRRQLWISI